MNSERTMADMKQRLNDLQRIIDDPIAVLSDEQVDEYVGLRATYLEAHRKALEAREAEELRLASLRGKTRIANALQHPA
ncbi:MAG TPA: hypothetical protein VKQ27_05495 [Acetobacteraceae bacterium]|nr:hypothetical protein [Acetobacteraceae bacterium]